MLTLQFAGRAARRIRRGRRFNFSASDETVAGVADPGLTERALTRAAPEVDYCKVMTLQHLGG
jgi:hypothetical protein